MDPPAAKETTADKPAANTSKGGYDSRKRRGAPGLVGVLKGAGFSETTKTDQLQGCTVEQGEYLTTNQGACMGDDQNSLHMGMRGPTLLEDFHLREKITHFDHERIPERVVHARGAAAHGYFQVYEDLSDLTMASLFRDPSKKTPVFVRFSTVAGSRGSADLARDVRGFATKFYTDEGVWDLVGNNIPVFFIQDAIKFPDLIHAVKPEPHNEIPQAASGHDTFYDFISLTPEASHMLMWVMSDRAIPRSYAMMEGFGVHTFRLVNAGGQSQFVKFHWKPKKGVFSVVWDEATKLNGKDADYHRRDLWEAIERGDFPEWELGIQVLDEETVGELGMDMLDATKIIPEEVIPVRRIGKMVLNRNPDNYFAETEQVAYCVSHIVPGIDFTDDPLLQGRLFSYLDTQISRLGVNFAQIPINRPVCPVANNQRDGKMQMDVHRGKVAYFPNSLASGCPMLAGGRAGAFTSFPAHVVGDKLRVRSETFSDHFTQATLFWNSMSAWEKNHIVDSLSFELNMCEVHGIRQRMLDEILVNIDDELARRVATNIGLEVKAMRKSRSHMDKSPALSQEKPVPTLMGRCVAILAAEGADAGQIDTVKAQLTKEGIVVEVIGPNLAPLPAAGGGYIAVDGAAPNCPSVLYDAVVVPGGALAAEAMPTMGPAKHFLLESFVHCKSVAAIAEGRKILHALSLAGFPGVVEGADAGHVTSELLKAMKMHRHFQRPIDMVPA